MNNVRRIAGVPLSLEILTRSSEAIRRGVSSVFVENQQSQQTDDNNSIKQKPTTKFTDFHDFSAQTFRAVSRVYLVEISSKNLIKLLAKNKQKQRDVTERLRRFNGWPSDGRWCALQRNAPLLKLLSNQIAAREFLENLSEDFATYPEGMVLEDGRGSWNPSSAYFVKEGILRVTPMHAAFSFRATGETRLPGHNEAIHPFECGRGSLVGDFNALIKHEKSPYRIICVEECELYHIERKQLLKFFEEFPGIKFQLIDRILMGWMLDVQVATGEHVDPFGGLVVYREEDNMKPF